MNKEKCVLIDGQDDDDLLQQIMSVYFVFERKDEEEQLSPGKPGERPNWS
jgi:hypothetical protein